MNKKHFNKFVTIGLILVLALSFTSCSSENATEGNVSEGSGGVDKIVLNMAASSTSEHSRYKAAEQFVKEVNEKSGGKIEAVMQFGGVLGSETATTQAVQEGTLEMVWVSDVGFSTVVPSTGFVNLPYLFPDYDAVDKYYFNGFLGEEVKSELESKGFKWLAWLENDYRWLSNNKLPIKSSSDLTGLKLRVTETPISVAFFKGIGTLPTSMSITEVATALQQKTIDGQDNGAILTYAYGFYEFQKYMTKTNHVYSGGAILMNLDTWKSLSPETQNIIQQAASAASEYQIKKNRSDVAEYEKLMKEYGMEIIEVTDELDTFFRKVAQDVWSNETITSVYDSEIMSRILKELTVK